MREWRLSALLRRDRAGREWRFNGLPARHVDSWLAGFTSDQGGGQVFRDRFLDMAVNYSQAARRHFDDCTTLVGGQRAGNASHLAGMAAECALKAILQGVGALVLSRSGRPSKREHICHINKLWDEFQATVAGPRAQAYILDGCNPFASWCVDHRYEEDRTIDLPTAESHRVAARTAMLLLERAHLEGVVP